MREMWAKGALAVENKKTIRKGAMIAHGACAPRGLNAKHNSSAMHRQTISAREVGVVLTVGIVLEESTYWPLPSQNWSCVQPPYVVPAQ